MKTVDITGKEWFDKANGNSYFSAWISLDYGTDKEKSIPIPFQYGHGDTYIDAAKKILTEHNYISPSHTQTLWSYCKENGIVLRTTKHKKCSKRDCVAFGKAD